jgi:uncharacterized membrane protein
MGHPHSTDSKQLSAKFRGLVVFLLVLGIPLRFVHLDQKIYWLDETFTSLHLSGYSDSEVRHQTEDGRIIRNQDFLKYQTSSAAKGMGDMVQRISMTAPELPPLYFGLARLWQQGLGQSVAVIRGFSAILSLLTFPCIYWLCWELWRSPVTGWTAVTLVALSPLHLETAQEARPYTLLILMILSCHAALLRARRSQTRLSWAVYAALIATGLYTHLIFGLVLIVHGLYMGFTERWRWQPQIKAYLTASCLGIAAFLPWVILALKNLPHGQQGLSPVNLSGINLIGHWLKGWVRGISLVFVDLNLNENSGRLELILFSIILLLLLWLILYAGYTVWHSESQPVRIFLGLAIAVPALVIILTNVLTDSIQSTTARYWWPTYLGMQLLMARFFVTHAIAVPSKFPRKKRWRAAFGSVLGIGALSCIVFSQSQFWWNKTDDHQIYQSAQIINAAQQPLVVSDSFFVEIFPLSHRLNPDVALQLWAEPNVPQIKAQAKTVFLYRPSDALIKAAEKRYPILVSRNLWRCTRN